MLEIIYYLITFKRKYDLEVKKKKKNIDNINQIPSMHKQTVTEKKKSCPFDRI